MRSYMPSIRTILDQKVVARGGNIPSRLFKFVSPASKYFVEGMRELFLRDQIYLSSRRDFNDPFDTSAALRVPDSDEEVSAFISGLEARHPGRDTSAIRSMKREELCAHIQRSFESSCDAMGVYSLTETVRQPLMWAHYAASHKGLALVFNHGIGAQFGAMPVGYQLEYPLASMITREGFDVSFVAIKGIDWLYEGEWRIVESNAADTWKTIHETVLAGVILGIRCSEETRRFVLDLMAERASLGKPLLTLFKSQVSPEAYGFVFKQYVGPAGWKEIDLP